MADNLTTFTCRLSRNLGASTSWNPKGLSRPVMGLLYLFLSTNVTVSVRTKLTLHRQLFVKSFCNKFRENPTSGLVADSASHTDRRTWSPHKEFFLFSLRQAVHFSWTDWPLKWRHDASTKRRKLFISQQIVTSQKTSILSGNTYFYFGSVDY
jgi:hypothetical protein